MCVNGLAIADPEDPDHIRSICQCDAGWTGDNCGTNCRAACNFRGTICGNDPVSGAPIDTCVCDAGFTGLACESVVTVADGETVDTNVGAAGFSLAGVVTDPGNAPLTLNEDGTVAPVEASIALTADTSSCEPGQVTTASGDACVSAVVDVDYPTLVVGTEAAETRRRLALRRQLQSWRRLPRHLRSRLRVADLEASLQAAEVEAQAHASEPANGSDWNVGGDDAWFDDGDAGEDARRSLVTVPEPFVPVEVTLVLPPELRGGNWTVSLVPLLASATTSISDFVVAESDAAACNSHEAYETEDGVLHATVCYAGSYQLAVKRASGSTQIGGGASGGGALVAAGAAAGAPSRMVQVLVLCVTLLASAWMFILDTAKW